MYNHIMSNLFLKSNPTLADIQTYVQQMVEERGFQNRTVSQICLLLTEEVGELIKSIRKSHTGMSLDANKIYELNPGEEIADILIVLTAISNMLGIDMEQMLREKEEVNKRRTWQ